MAIYDNYPAMDENNKFPPAVRAAFVTYPELIAAFAAKSVETTKANVVSPAFSGTPTGITKAHVGLGSVDNTPDVNKPVSSLQAVELGLLAKGEVKRVANAGTKSGISILDMVDVLQVDLVANRKYRAVWKFVSLTATASLAIAANLIKHSSDNTTSAGTSVEDNVTLWTAPVLSSGQTHTATWCWTPSLTETVYLKTTMLRLTGSTGIDISGRRLFIFDEGAQP
jgi:hypothetical protein